MKRLVGGNATAVTRSETGRAGCIHFTIWAAASENQQPAYAKTKTQISCAVTAQLISAFVFATRIVQSLFVQIPRAAPVTVQAGSC